MTQKKLHKIKRIIKREGNYHRFIYRNMECKLKRHDFFKIWCGYVTFNLYESTYIAYKLMGNNLLDDIQDTIRCHGGITYFNVENNKVTIGFDCSHAGDLNIATSDFSFSYGVYRNRHYVTHECKHVVHQLEEILYNK